MHRALDEILWGLKSYALCGILVGGTVGCGAPESPPAGPVTVEPVRIVTDGRFDEWGEARAVLLDPEDVPPEAAVDLGEVRVTDDPRWLHLAVEVRRPVTAQRLRGTLEVLFDGDGDAGTGAEVAGLPGVDAIVVLSRRDKTANGEVGAGVGVRGVTAEGPGDLRPGYEIGLLTAPTHAARRIEVRLDRGRFRRSLPPLFAAPTVRLKLVFEDAAGRRDETPVAELRLTTPFREAPEPAIFEPSLRRGEGVFRVLSWNVAGPSLRQRPAAFRRILAALEPDVVLLDEVYAAVTPADLEDFFSQPPLAAVGEWRFVLGRGGGRQKNVVAAHLPIRPEGALLDVAYPAAALDRLGEEAAPWFRELLEQERDVGLATAGAWVEAGGREILFVPVDLQSSGYDGSPRDRLRVLQASALRQRITSALGAAAGAAPVVIGGDFNLVGSVRPLELLQGLQDGAEGGLVVAEAYRLTDRSQVTWRDVELGDFGPGRLDFQLYDAAFLTVDRAFVFDSGELSEAHLGRLGVERDDSWVTSRHLPVICDYRWNSL